jgi:hypothetical protein
VVTSRKATLISLDTATHKDMAHTAINVFFGVRADMLFQCRLSVDIDAKPEPASS